MAGGLGNHMKWKCSKQRPWRGRRIGKRQTGVLAFPFAFGVVCLVLLMLHIFRCRFATCVPALGVMLDWCLCRCPGLQGPYLSAFLAGVSAWAQTTSASAGAQLASQGLALCKAPCLAGVACFGVEFGQGQRRSQRRNVRQPEQHH